VRRAPRYRERAERRMDRRGRDDRAPAGTCVASAAGIRGPRAAARRIRHSAPNRSKSSAGSVRSGALHRRATRLGGTRPGSRFALPATRSCVGAGHSAGGLDTAPRSHLALHCHRRGQSERAAYWVSGRHEAAAGQLDLSRQAWTLAERIASAFTRRIGLPRSTAGRGVLLPAARALTSSAVPPLGQVLITRSPDGRHWRERGGLSGGRKSVPSDPRVGGTAVSPPRAALSAPSWLRIAAISSNAHCSLIFPRP